MFGAGQGASAPTALQVIGVASLSLNPLLQVNVATLPWLSPLVLVTSPFVGALALDPVHCVRVQLPLGVAPSQLIVPLNPALHAHARPSALLEFSMLQGAAVKRNAEVVRMYVRLNTCVCDGKEYRMRSSTLLWPSYD